MKKIPSVAKGQIGWNKEFGWPLIINRAFYGKLDKPYAILECEVFGLEHECGSIYASQFRAEKDLDYWKGEVVGLDQRYFKGELVAQGV